MREVLRDARDPSGAADSRESGRRDACIDQIGKGLAAWVRLARTLEIDPEQALRRVDDAAVASIRANQHQATHTQSR